MTIKDFSKLCNCTTQTLRYYESVQALDYVKIINLQDAMFSIDEIKEILAQEDFDIVKALDVKIAEQKAKLEKIKQIQMSYRKEYMQMQDLIKRTRDKLNESTGSYDAEKGYGISEEYYKDFIMACTYEAEGELWTEYTMKTKKLKSGV